MNILAIIPARAGSKGIPKKNVRMLVGKPLICYSVENAVASKYITHVAVTTDDEEVKTLATKYGVYVIDRPAELCKDDVTLDAVIYHAYEEMKERTKCKYDYVITLQPTSPLLTTPVLDQAIEKHIHSEVDTTISGVNDSHLAWGEKECEFYPLYEKRVNRQYLPKHLKETGAFVITNSIYVKPDKRFGTKINIFETPESQSIDIDTWNDWVLAEAHLKRKNILLRVDGYDDIGMGHIYRALLLAYNLTEHNIIFCLNQQSDIGIEKIKNSFFKYYVIADDDELLEVIGNEKIDIIVNDILDTNSSYVEKLKAQNVRVVNFEDLGSGSYKADAVINALYEKQFKQQTFYWGKDYYCLRDEFLLSEKSKFSKQVKNVLVLFGGTDPCNLTEKVVDAIAKLHLKDIKYTFVLGLGYKYYERVQERIQNIDLDIEVVKNVNHISAYMKSADLAISSQGRTMFELASMCVPTIILAQNEREQTHGFGDLSNGFLNLGLGKDIDKETIALSLKWLIETEYVRKSMYDKMSNIDLKHGIDRVKKLILNE